MIDTVILRVNFPNFRINPSVYKKFSPSAHGIFGPLYYSFGSGKVIKCVLQIKSKDKKLGMYQPRVTLLKAIRAGGISVFLHIEFSAPKVLYNNNFDELGPGDFGAVCAELYRKLYKLGIEIKRKQIERADDSFYTNAGYILKVFKYADKLFDIATTAEKRDLIGLVACSTRTLGPNGLVLQGSGPFARNFSG